jgi:hypothetical protein
VSLAWTDCAATLGIGGLWAWSFLRDLALHPSFDHGGAEVLSPAEPEESPGHA